MTSIPSSYRETDPTSSSDEHRYSPSDYDRLSNSTVSSPPFTPDFAHEPLPAEYTNARRTVDIADKRAIAYQAGQAESSELRKLQGSHQQDSIRKTPSTSVKEEEGGKQPQIFRRHMFLRTHLPKDITLINNHEVRHSTILPRVCQCLRWYATGCNARCRQPYRNSHVRVLLSLRQESQVATRGTRTQASQQELYCHKDWHL